MATLDSLPYYDQEPTEEERDAVDILVSREMRSNTTIHPSISTLNDDLYFSQCLINKEHERVAQGKKLSAIDLSRYEDIIAPESTAIQDWRDAVIRNIVAADAMRDRQDNLSLLKSLGTNAWTTHVYQLEYALKQIESELLAIRQRTERVNVERKGAQTVAGENLTKLDERWRALVSGNLELSVACAVLAREVEELR